MDIFVRFPLIFMMDVMFANRACSDFFPGFDYVSSLLPMDLAHIRCILVILTIIESKVKDLPGNYLSVFLWLLFDQIFYAFHWIVGCFPENYFLELFLKFLFISIGAYAFKRCFEESQLVMLMAALFLYLYLEENPTRMQNFVKYALFTTLMFVIPDDEEVDEEANSLADPRSIVYYKPTFQKLGLYWIFIVMAQPLTRFNDLLSQWKLWNGVFVDGMSTPVRVCAMIALLLILTYYAFELFKMLGFGEVFGDSMSGALYVTVHFSAFVFNYRVWDLEPEERAELAQIHFFIHLVIFLDRCYDEFWFFAFPANEEEAKLRWKALPLYFLTFIICAYVLYWSRSTLGLNSHSLILLVSIACLVLRMSAHFILYNVALKSQWFCSNYDTVRSVRIVFVSLRFTRYAKNLIMALCVLWLSVFHAVTAIRVYSLYDFVRVDLKIALEFYRECNQPTTCIRSLPKASEEQLAEKDDVCLVCHEKMEEARVTPCNHYYHPNCLHNWLKKDNKCPLCQTVLYAL